MSESTTEHHYADGPPPAAVPPATFQEPHPELAESRFHGVPPLPGAEEYARQLAAAAAPTGEVPAEPAPPAGPVPILEGTFAIFLTPDESIVVAYRPRGAEEDKRFVLPAFIVAMATRQSGHTPTEIFQALKDGAL